MNQKEQLLTHFKKHKKITPAEAYSQYGIYRLSARILDLRNEGHNILTSIVEKGGSRGVKHFAEYRLVKAAKVAL